MHYVTFCAGNLFLFSISSLCSENWCSYSWSMELAPAWADPLWLKTNKGARAICFRAVSAHEILCSLIGTSTRKLCTVHVVSASVHF